MVDNIPSVPSDGNIATWLVPAIADPKNPTATELAAASIVDISCYLTKDGFAMTTEQASIPDERLCSTQVYNQPGTKTYGLTLTGIDNTNATDGATPTPAALPNDLVDTLVEGVEQFLVRRRGVPFDTPVAADQKVTVIPFKPGVKQDVAAESNSVTRSTWTNFVTGDVEVEVAVVAGS